MFNNQNTMIQPINPIQILPMQPQFVNTSSFYPPMQQIPYNPYFQNQTNLIQPQIPFQMYNNNNQIYQAPILMQNTQNMQFQPMMMQSNPQFLYQQLYQPPMYIQMPQNFGKVIEMQPMGPYKQNQNVHLNDSRNRIPQSNTSQNGIKIDDSPKRCLNCATYYKELNNKVNSCRYHTGQYVSFGHTGSLARWNCCKEFEKNARGCKIDRHMEDKKTTSILSKFNTNQPQQMNLNINNPPPYNMVKNNNENQNDTLKVGNLLDLPELFPQTNSNNKLETNNNHKNNQHIQSLLQQKDEKELVCDKNGYFIIDHQVQLEDTLAGLALYYGTTVNEIKLLNNLFSNDIFLKKTLKIRTKVPKQKIRPHVEESKEHKEIRLIRRFVLFTNSKPEEARFYLSNNNWDVKQAVSEYKSDSS